MMTNSPFVICKCWLLAWVVSWWSFAISWLCRRAY